MPKPGRTRKMIKLVLKFPNGRVKSEIELTAPKDGIPGKFVQRVFAPNPKFEPVVKELICSRQTQYDRWLAEAQREGFTPVECE